MADFTPPGGGGAGGLDWRIGQSLLGSQDGVNQIFTTANLFVNDGKLTIALYYNGQRLTEGATEDYTASESGGSGTGYDTVTLSFAPIASDNIRADYVKKA